MKIANNSPLTTLYVKEEEGDPTLYATKHAFEGDIITNKTQIEKIRRSGDMTRNAIKTKYGLWPNCNVPYVISSNYNSYERSVIASAFKEYHQKTCIK